MTRRERIIAAVKHQETDYCPYNIDFTLQEYEKISQYLKMILRNKLAERGIVIWLQEKDWIPDGNNFLNFAYNLADRADEKMGNVNTAYLQMGSKQEIKKRQRSQGMKGQLVGQVFAKVYEVEPLVKAVGTRGLLITVNCDSVEKAQGLMEKYRNDWE